MKRAVASFAAAAAAMLAGGVAFSATEHVSLLTGIYWAVATGATVGYGDVAAHDSAGKLISIAVILTSIPLLGDAYQHLHLHRHRKQQMQDKQDKGEADG